MRWSNGVAVRCEETKLLLDPLESDPSISELLVSHAHYDHARGFEFPIQRKYSTKETFDLYQTDSGHRVGNWVQARYGRRFKLGGIEVEAHDAGHVLGSAQYEIITPEGSLVYASHINFTDTLLTHAAEVAPCDLLIVEATYPSVAQSSPRESVIADIVKWALECMREHRIPAFVTEPIGDAQELVRIFNLWTEVSVIVHPRIAHINKVYENQGTGLRYLDASTEEGLHVVEQGECVVIVPRRFDTARYGNFRTAHISTWATRVDDTQKVFPLTGRADLAQLLRFIEEAKPKTVLTFYGASELLARMITKKLGIQAKHLTTGPAPKRTQRAKVDEKRVLAFQETVMQSMEMSNFTYEKRDIVALGLKEGFRIGEIEEALGRLTKDGKLKYSRIVDGYTLEVA